VQGDLCLVELLEQQLPTIGREADRRQLPRDRVEGGECVLGVGERLPQQRPVESGR